MATSIRVAVLGLYNSGSTGVAGLLHRLGVNMGPPFYETSHLDSPVNFYEPHDLSEQLRRWWDEPKVEERTPATDRVRYLARWVDKHEAAAAGPVGAKHPLLTLCADDLVPAWGSQVRFVWAWRSFDESLKGLRRRAWFPGYEQRLQGRLWESISGFAGRRPDVFRMEWKAVLADPAGAARQLAEVVGVLPTELQVAAAAAFIRTGGGG